MNMIVCVYCFGAGFVTGVGVGAFQYAVYSIHRVAKEVNK